MLADASRCSFLSILSKINDNYDNAILKAIDRRNFKWRCFTAVVMI